MNKLSRNISLRCSTCGNDQFSYDSEVENPIYKCTDCSKEFTKDELLVENQFLINTNIEEVKKEAINELQKELNKLFKNTR